MTQKTVAKDDRGEPMKMPGWFSWRHKTRDAHDAARQRYQHEHGKAARQRKAEARPAPQHDRTRAHRLGRCSCSAVS